MYNLNDIESESIHLPRKDNKMKFHVGPWGWSIGQRARLLLWRSVLESRRRWQFCRIIEFVQKENKKRPWLTHLKNIMVQSNFPITFCFLFYVKFLAVDPLTCRKKYFRIIIKFPKLCWKCNWWNLVYAKNRIRSKVRKIKFSKYG